MTDARLLRRVDEVAERLRTLRRHRLITLAWLALALLVGLLNLIPAGQQHALPVLLIGTLLVLMVGLLMSRQSTGDRTAAAEHIESAFRDLDSRLITAMQQHPRVETGNFGFLQGEVLGETLQHAATHNWKSTIPSSRLLRTRLTMYAAFLLCLVTGTQALKHARRIPEQPVVASSESDGQVTADPLSIHVDPGDAELERGTSLLVLARFDGPLPENVVLIAHDVDQREIRIPLKKSLDDPLYGGRLPDVQRNLSYRVEYDGTSSDEFHITTFSYPELVRADARLTYPQYTGLKPQTIEDVRRVSVVEGTDVTWLCQLNKPVASALLVGDDGTELPLSVDPESSELFQLQATWRATGIERHRFKLHLTDEEGRTNREPPSFFVEVVPNKPPELKVAFPKKDLRVSPLQEVSLQARAHDDFGLLEYGLKYLLPSGEEQTVKFGDRAAPGERPEMDYLLALENLQVSPNELITYYFYADDVGPDGESRRAYSDMFFAEVRPFEEIFRQVTPPSGEGEGQPSESQRLVELQRQIVIGIWNLIRREHRQSPSGKFPEDVQVLAESQAKVLELTQEVAAELDDLLMKQHADEAIGAMTEAVEAFTEVVRSNLPSDLP
ncbi:MAG: hypothetical protein KDA90_11905, partial [Planctomycetaceae bacterium]|nr:hypothetical protein [Planctomycetaceae bacterium]